MSQLVATSPSWINKPICVKPDPRFDQSHEPFILEANCLDYLSIVPTWWTGRTDEAGDKVVQFKRRRLPVESWAIVHIPTGKIFAFSLTEEAAREFCEHGQALGDIWAFSGGKYSVLREETKKRICEFIKEFRKLIY